MRVDLFDFDLPPERIAERPMQPREAARLLRLSAAGLEDRHVGDLPALLRPDDLLVFNDTRVIPARLHGERGAVKVEVLLHQRLADGRWSVFARPGKRLRPGDTIRFAEGFGAVVEEKRDSGEVVLRFSLDGEAFSAALEQHGEMPLPPYIRRAQDAADRQDYQTVFAARDGAVAAPTAGLHFTPALLEHLTARGIETLTVTLHVGAGTFQPVKADDTEAHRMHAEYGEISADSAGRLNAARAAGRRIVACGTTSLRVLESAADASRRFAPFADETRIFITPGYQFRGVDALITNFHLPRSTLFMLVSALMGLERMQQAYAHAIRTGYRFFSYGDACLLEP
jgi:S-adenosylmethionine:tRNA ribosyltransferase-isomerase